MCDAGGCPDVQMCVWVVLQLLFAPSGGVRIGGSSLKPDSLPSV